MILCFSVICNAVSEYVNQKSIFFQNAYSTNFTHLSEIKGPSCVNERATPWAAQTDGSLLSQLRYQVTCS